MGHTKEAQLGNVVGPFRLQPFLQHRLQTLEFWACPSSPSLGALRGARTWSTAELVRGLRQPPVGVTHFRAHRCQLRRTRLTCRGDTCDFRLTARVRTHGRSRYSWRGDPRNYRRHSAHTQSGPGFRAAAVLPRAKGIRISSYHREGCRGMPALPPASRRAIVLRVVSAANFGAGLMRPAVCPCRR